MFILEKNMKISIIVVWILNYVIGKDNIMLWYLFVDLVWFC